MAWYPEYVNVDTFRKLRDEFNINTIRLAMYTAEDGGYCVSDDTARQQMLACLTFCIEAAIQLDMYVIVDWHILSDSNPNLYKETALSFFERIASTLVTNQTFCMRSAMSQIVCAYTLNLKDRLIFVHYKSR